MKSEDMVDMRDMKLMKHESSLSKRYEELTEQMLTEQCAVFGLLDMGELDDFINMLAGKKRIFVAGAGREGIAMRGFAMRLMHLCKEVHWIWDDTVPGIGAEDVFLLADGRGGIGSFRYTLQQVKAAKTEIAIVTCNPEGKNVSEFADQVLFVHASAYRTQREDVVPTAQPMGNQFEQHLFLLFDVISILLKERLGLTEEQMESRHRNWE